MVVANVPREQENQGQHFLHLVGGGWGECDAQWVNLVLLRHLCEINGMYRLAACTWHFPSWAVIDMTNTNFRPPPPQPFLFHAHYWLCSEKGSGVCSLLGSQVWRHHLNSFQGLHKIRSETKQPQEILLNFLSQESLTARKDALMGTLYSQAKLPLESLPLLCQLIKP